MTLNFRKLTVDEHGHTKTPLAVFLTSFLSEIKITDSYLQNDSFWNNTANTLRFTGLCKIRKVIHFVYSNFKYFDLVHNKHIKFIFS